MQNVRSDLVRLCAVALALLVCSFQVVAQPVVPQAVNKTSAGFAAWYFGGGYQFGTGGGANMVPLTSAATNPLNLSGWTSASNYGIAPTATGITIDTRSTLPLGGGKTAPIDVRTRIVASSLGKAAGALLRTAPVLGTGIAVYDLLRELNFDASRDAAGVLHVYRLTTGEEACIDKYPAPVNLAGGACEWSHEWKTYGAPILSSDRKSCSAWVYCSADPIHPTHLVGGATDSANLKSSSGPVPITDFTGAETSQMSETTVEAFENEVASKSGWPVSSAVIRTVVSAIDKGQSIDVESPTLSGPASVLGSKTTATKADGSSTVTQTKYELSYDNSSGRLNVKEVQTTTSTAADGTVVGTDTATQEEPALDQSECEKAPDTLGCMKAGTPEDQELSRDTKNISIASMTFRGGACPAPVAFSVFGKPYEISYGELCARLASISALLLALSALLAAWIFADGFKVS